ncbi:hypothetical protein EVAR_26826_1, partial [Eumeta japonica]
RLLFWRIWRVHSGSAAAGGARGAGGGPFGKDNGLVYGRLFTNSARDALIEFATTLNLIRLARKRILPEIGLRSDTKVGPGSGTGARPGSESRLKGISKKSFYDFASGAASDKCLACG